MFEASNLLFIYVETPLHAGTGRGLGAVDLPIQRERVTGYPIVQASGLKGCLRTEAQGKINQGLTQDEFFAIFGPETDRASDHAGALSPGDAKILLLPVRSLAGVFAWVTSRQVLERLLRDLAAIKDRVPEFQSIHDDLQQPLEAIRTDPPEPRGDNEERWALVSEDTSVQAGDQVVLEEFAFTPKPKSEVGPIGQWLANNALPQSDEYKYWHDNLAQHLVILPEDDFRDFCLFGIEVATRVALNQKTKTVAEGPWTEEYLPSDTLLYAPLHASPSRAPGVSLTAAQVLEKVRTLGITRTTLGGDETVGRGIVYLRFLPPSAAAVSAPSGEEG